MKNETINKRFNIIMQYYCLSTWIRHYTVLMEKHPLEELFGFPFPNHPFWGRKAFLPDAKHIRVIRVEQQGDKVILEDGSAWQIYFFDSAKTSKWIPEKTRVVVREGDGQTSFHTTLLEEVDNDHIFVSARRMESEDE